MGNHTCINCGKNYSGLRRAIEIASGQERHGCADGMVDIERPMHMCKNAFCQYPETDPCDYCKFVPIHKVQATPCPECGGKESAR